MSYETNLIIRIVIAIALAVFFGNGSVVAFNNIRAKWFEDYDENDPAKEITGEIRRIIPPDLVKADNEGRQRLPSTPWKYAFTGYFGIVGIYLAVRGGGGIGFEISVMCVLCVILLMAISDQLYKVVPDQFSLCLAVMSVAFINYHDKWWEPFAGAGIGLGISLVIFGLGLLLFRTGSLGGADIKFFTCMGLIAGPTGIVVIYILTTLLFALEAFVLIITGRGTIRDSNAMMPAACAAVTVYFLFLWNLTDFLFVL
ncbi:MAG: prepilin peptidase [Mogibacterium sp.]|nr:prepilin peptidase [Mogibacterium sp.]